MTAKHNNTVYANKENNIERICLCKIKGNEYGVREKGKRKIYKSIQIII